MQIQVLDEMLRTSPQRPFVDPTLLSECMRACLECGQTCVACADACLGEEGVERLKRCIRLNLDCADVCAASARLLGRQLDPHVELIRHQLYTLSLACRACAEECDEHAKMHEHCRVCAASCRSCADACDRLLDAIGGVPNVAVKH